ncbi:hypothetical protein LXA43DRAFT_1089609 [Ganoderma leucocontextum]|nr:hypothetical protein LXA43DRAFT_1089609 [Ganoderma leucocontextum]
MSNNRYLEPTMPVYPGEVSYEYRDTRTMEVSHPFSLWELHQLMDHHLPDYRAPISPTPPSPRVLERLTLYGMDGRMLKLDRRHNETRYPTDTKGRLGKAIGSEYFHYFTFNLRWDPRKVELLLKNAFLIKTWHEKHAGWHVQVEFREVDFSVVNQRRW